MSRGLDHPLVQPLEAAAQSRIAPGPAARARTRAWVSGAPRGER